MQTFNRQFSEWDQIISSLPNPHFLQTWEWAQVKAKYGWESMSFIWESERGNRESIVAAAMALGRTVSLRGMFKLNILYVPKGPLMDWGNESLRKQVLDELQSFARDQKAIFLKIDPDIVLGTGIPGSEDSCQDNGGQAVRSELKRRGWLDSSEQIQFRNTVVIDLSATEEEMLARMKQKTRYNIRLAEKKGVTVRVGTLDDLPMLYKMYAETSVRDGFVIRDENYYQTVWKAFMQSSHGQPSAQPLIAEVDGEPVAAIFLFSFARRAYYVYGMSRNAHREKMPAYLLQWEAMKRAKALGCKVYDLWGAPDEFNESDSMWGVFRFKEGLGGEVVRTLGAYDFAPNAFWYKLYTEMMPRVLNMMRSRGKARVRGMLEG
ncbi:MAG: aminoacyltransferase [Anaerolineales bacterium]|nr:aminoacyltransferase [Anaerolineales bacterium]